MKNQFSPPGRIQVLVTAVLLLPAMLFAANYQVIGWNEFGNDRMDSGYSVFSLWPPGNTIHAHVIYQGRRLTNATGISVTYQAVADPDGSINSTSQGKSDFWDFDSVLFGTNLAPDMGLSGYAMPGTNNTPQDMTFNATHARFTAVDVPITPNDDAGQKKYYPMMRLIAKTNTTPLATNDIVLAISDELNCAACHASGSGTAAQPTNGWVWNTDPKRDYRLNILRKHDELKNPVTYAGILFSNGYNPAGLYRTVVADGMPIRCTKCHSSTIVPGSGFGNIPPLTRAIHTNHANVIDPNTGLSLNSSTDRSACYYCHPGVTTKAFRGAMADAVGTNGLHAIQCQSCHGPVSAMAAVNRTGWIDLPDCQSCHVGRATNAIIRYTSAFTSPGVMRQTTDPLFATITNVAFGNYSLFRNSTNHGKLFCSGCHGSPHAEFPADRNDNIRAIQTQGHVGMLSECSACHTDGRTQGGPHDMHEADDNWANGGHFNGSSACQNCHGKNGSSNYGRGTELSELKSDHYFTTDKYGSKGGWRGYRVGCFTCHNGSDQGSATPWSPSLSASVTSNTASGTPLTFKLTVTDGNIPNQLTNTAFLVRVISQPANGQAGITNWNTTNWAAIYTPDPGFVGTNSFTFAAWNTYVDSALYTATVTVTQGVFSISANTHVPSGYPARWSAPFTVLPILSNVVGTVTFDWDFGDATAHSTNQYATHAYASAGNYPWSVVSQLITNGVSARTATNSGTIVIGPPVSLAANRSGGSVVLTWPHTTADALLEQSPVVGSGANWTTCTNAVLNNSGMLTVTVPTSGMKFYRLKKL